MSRARSPNRDKAFEIYKQHNGEILLKDIATQLGVKDAQIRKWKSQDKWEENLKGTLPKNKRNVTNEIDTKKTTKASKQANCDDLNKLNKESSKTNSTLLGGAPIGNKNAVGNIGGGAPLFNKNAETHGFFSKYLPKDTLEIIEEIKEKNPLDILLEQITIQYAAIIRAQKIMYVKDKNEMIKEIKKHKDTEFGEEIEYEFQFAWDRQATFLNAQSRAMGELRSLIKQANTMINENPELASEEQKLRVDKLRAEIGRLSSDDLDDELHIIVDYGD
ncbi:MAG: phage terminase small subunit [Intestinibacter bartlettii]|jgi:uncharacterized protein YjcR